MKASVSLVTRNGEAHMALTVGIFIHATDEYKPAFLEDVDDGRVCSVELYTSASLNRLKAGQIHRPAPHCDLRR